MKAKTMLLLFLVGALLINTFSKAEDPADESEDSVSEDSTGEESVGEESMSEESSISEDSGASDSTTTLA